MRDATEHGFNQRASLLGVEQKLTAERAIGLPQPRAGFVAALEHIICER